MMKQVNQLSIENAIGMAMTIPGIVVLVVNGEYERAIAFHEIMERYVMVEVRENDPHQNWNLFFSEVMEDMVRYPNRTLARIYVSSGMYSPMERQINEETIKTCFWIHVKV